MQVSLLEHEKIFFGLIEESPVCDIILSSKWLLVTDYICKWIHFIKIEYMEGL